MPNSNIIVKNFQDFFPQSCQMRVSYYLDIDNFFKQQIFYSPKTKFGKFVFLGQNILPDFWDQINQEQFFILQDGQTPHQLFLTIIYPNGPTGKSVYPFLLFLGQWSTLANPGIKHGNRTQTMVNKGT